MELAPTVTLTFKGSTYKYKWNTKKHDIVRCMTSIIFNNYFSPHPLKCGRHVGLLQAQGDGRPDDGGLEDCVASLLLQLALNVALV